ncbi:MAG: hypothetical protein GVY32_02235 [Gammaproteobacteria bacterium]|jgi:hypothetical protein|nr:hypothetical protein [Gammaproteobacteria bacterium]
MNPKTFLLAGVLAAVAPPAAVGNGSLAGTICEFPDLGTMTPVPLAPGASPAAGTGGDIPGGRWELIAARYDNSPLPITGDARSIIELDGSAPTAGMGSLALEVSITSPTTDQISETGAGPYSASGTVLNFQNDCGDELLLGSAEYSVDDSGVDPVMTLWGNYEITDPFPVTILIETEFLLVEPIGVEDPVFSDRFETP